MTLRETVSKIQGYEVTETHARIFASEQYGVLSCYIRGQFIDSFNKSVAKKNVKERRHTSKIRLLPKHVYKTSKSNRKPYLGKIAIKGKMLSTKTHNTIDEVLTEIEEIKKKNYS